MTNNQNFVVVGAGFAGSVIARELAEAGRRVVVLEKRSHVSGNMYDEKDKYGFLIQKFGPHILFTNSYEVVEYLSKYSRLIQHDCKMLSFIDGHFIQLPFNFKSILQLFGDQKGQIIVNKLRSNYPFEARVSIYDLMECGDQDISNFSKSLYKKAFEPYISKMWDLSPTQISKSVINRVKICMGFDSRYLNCDFQYLPCKGFNSLIEKILNHENIQVKLDCDASAFLSFSNDSCLYKGSSATTIIYTGRIDELFKERFGPLPYRSLLFDTKYFNARRKLPEEIISTPQDPLLIRKTEYKYFTPLPVKSAINRTVVVTETPIDYDPNDDQSVPCYPIINEPNLALYKKYSDLSKKYKNLVLCGRLAEYQYFNMDQVILHALDISKKILR